MTFDRRKYNREYMRKMRAPAKKRRKEKRMIAKGKCPVCEILLISKYHTGCPYLLREQ